MSLLRSTSMKKLILAVAALAAVAGAVVVASPASAIPPVWCPYC
ncbi:putative membrane protein [Asticcacaulis biprosthecium C19]|uniref:Putative membrane protein n=1 Tax=Asticcacaulis biprosthecium C19 TaxID=715226 RepID=F4QT58_9CAUL|nr:putative membrane protein [Asticcacaulis biprosthecium C19]